MVQPSRPPGARGLGFTQPGPALLQVRQFAEQWYEAWNAHDLDRILAHYRDDVTLRSPMVVAITGREDGIVVGRDALASYFSRGLEAYLDLRFEPLALFVGVDSVVLNYRSVRGLLTAEFMGLDPNLRVKTVIAHYYRLP
jgi:hypothetical protein